MSDGEGNGHNEGERERGGGEREGGGQWEVGRVGWGRGVEVGRRHKRLRKNLTAVGTG